MFSNIWLVTGIVFVLWLGVMGYYLYSSRQQESLENQVEAVQKLLDDSGEFVLAVAVDDLRRLVARGPGVETLRRQRVRRRDRHALDVRRRRR